MFSYTTCFFVIALLVLYNIVVVFHYNRISDTREMGLEAKQTLFDQEESGEQRNEDVGAYERILAVGDLHGDLKALCAVLLASEVVNDEGDWIGGSTTLVQTGDIMDRTRGAITHEDEASERLMVEWLYHLGEQAKKEGGQVHMLLGNHELMNIEGQMNYASQENVKDFGGMYNRIAAFAPGGPFARTMAERHKVVLKIGDWVFVHAGFTKHLSVALKGLAADGRSDSIGDGDKKSDSIGDGNEGTLSVSATHNSNANHGGSSVDQVEDTAKVVERTIQEGVPDTVTDVQAELSTNSQAADAEAEIQRRLRVFNAAFSKVLREGSGDLTEAERAAIFVVLAADSRGPLWTRDFGYEMTETACKALQETLSTINASHMVIGHTPQFFKQEPTSISAICNEALWRVDVGMSRGFEMIERAVIRQRLYQRYLNKKASKGDDSGSPGDTLRKNRERLDALMAMMKENAAAGRDRDNADLVDESLELMAVVARDEQLSPTSSGTFSLAGFEPLRRPSALDIHYMPATAPRTQGQPLEYYTNVITADLPTNLMIDETSKENKLAAHVRKKIVLGAVRIEMPTEAVAAPPASPQGPQGSTESSVDSSSQTSSAPAAAPSTTATNAATISAAADINTDARAGADTDTTISTDIETDTASLPSAEADTEAIEEAAEQAVLLKAVAEAEAAGAAVEGTVTENASAETVVGAGAAVTDVLDE